MSGHGGPSKPPRLAGPYQNPEGTSGSWKASPPDWLYKRLSKLPSFPAAVSNLPAEEYPPLGFEGRRVLYLDPPYLNTTGYKRKFSRESLIDVARKWDEAGWEVVISEAEPIAALGWYSVDIGAERVGQKRTFSKQQSEYLTMNRAPKWKPSIQGRLF